VGGGRGSAVTEAEGRVEESSPKVDCGLCSAVGLVCISNSRARSGFSVQS